MGVPNSSAAAAAAEPSPASQNNATPTTGNGNSNQAPSNLTQTQTTATSADSPPAASEQCNLKKAGNNLNNVAGNKASNSSGANASSPTKKDSKQVAPAPTTGHSDTYSGKLAAALNPEETAGAAAVNNNNNNNKQPTSSNSASNSTTTNNKPHTNAAEDSSTKDNSSTQLQPTSDETLTKNHKSNQMQTPVHDNGTDSSAATTTTATNGINIDASTSSFSSGVEVSNTSSDDGAHSNASAPVEAVAASETNDDENQAYAPAASNADSNESQSNNKESTAATQPSQSSNKNNNAVNKQPDTTTPQPHSSYSHHNKTHHQHQHHHNHHHNQHQHHHNHHHNQQYHSNHHSAETLSKTNLYIRGLNADTSDDDLFSLCSRFGSIVSTKAILDKNTNKCKGYGFVDFETPAAAETAVAELQKQGVLVHMAKQQEADPTNLYIANLPQMMTEWELEALLRPYGEVVSTRILMDQNRQPRGVGFARMETKEQCDLIITSLNGQIVKGSKEPLSVKFADGANKKRVHHFQHKPIGGNVFMNEHLWRNSSNDLNYPLINNNAGNRNFHVGSFDHSRQNHALSHHNNGMVKHQQMLTSISGYHPHHQGGGQHPHPVAHHNHQQHHQSQLQQQHHHGHNHSPHSSHRSQNQGPYTGGSNFPISGSMGANDASQWLHPPQPGQPYVLQPQMMAPAQAIDPSLHYVNLANQMQGLQIANPAVSGYLSPQQWPVWPSGVGQANKHSNSPQQSGNHAGDHRTYNDTD